MKSTNILLNFFFISICISFIKVENFAQQSIENEKFLIETLENGAITFLDKSKNESWGNGLPGWISLADGEEEKSISLADCDVTSTKTGNAINLQFQSNAADEKFTLKIEVSLQEDFFEIGVKELITDLDFLQLDYPAHLFKVESGIENGYVVVPNLQGIMIPSRYDAGFMRYGQNIWSTIADVEKVWSFESGTINMPWFGAHRGGSSVFAYMLTSSDAYLRVIGNSVVGEEGRTLNGRNGDNPGTRLSSLTPLWINSKKRLAYPRKMRIELVDNGYVGMAKHYREYAKASGRWTSMKEKIAKNPDYEKIVGAIDLKVYIYTNRKNEPYYRSWSEPVLNGYSKIHTTFKEISEIADDLADMEVDKAMILLGGWNRKGYDREHVDMWPPAEKAGGIKGLQAASKHVKDKGYLFALHDNYNDFYPDAPSFDKKYILQHEDGSLVKGGVWDGGPSYLICTSTIEPLLDRNLDSIQNNIDLDGYYFDVITNTWHDECFAENHGMTRKGDLENRLGLLQNIVDRGLVIGGERGADWAMPVAAFYEGMQGGGADYHYGIAYRTGLTIPLFYLVYHDCVVGYWQHGTPAGREDHTNHMLLDLLYAQPTSWSIVYDQWEDLKPLIKDAAQLQAKLHQRTAHEPMVGHQIMTDDHMVQKSWFGDGTEVWVNFGITTYKNGDITLPPKGYRVKTKEGIQAGAYKRGRE